MSVLEIEIGDRNLVFNESQLRLVQAIWRGILVRKHLAVVREEYGKILREVEGPDVSLQLTWPSHPLAPPTISKTGKPGLIIIKNDPPKRVPSKKNEPSALPNKTTANTEDISKENICDSKKMTPQTEPIQEMEISGKDNKSGLTISEKTEDMVAQKFGNESLGVDENNTINGPPLHPHTEVWDSIDVHSPTLDQSHPLKVDRESLLKEKGQISMELLWIQKAIESRKQYLRIRHEMDCGST